ncbi:hypothetical protein M0R04_11075 [Candidatus Dojkabacteria bacterium]|jgi:hypothetical protein|nr:hypothetical protein [Candidatus Dojkabacteria bacterium]
MKQYKGGNTMQILVDGKEYIPKDEQNSNTNSGNWNSGYWNSGNLNSGNRNSGNWNSGYWNSGYWNSGYLNSGNRNSGNRNSGNLNSGNRNSGNLNSGDWNSGNRNSGYLNIDEPYLRIFGKITKFKIKDVGTKIIFPNYFYFDLTEWVSVSSMTDEEKAKYPKYAVTEGFLRVFEYKQAWKNRFNKATKEDIAKTLKLPNFNYGMFETISGINKKMIQEKLK